MKEPYGEGVASRTDPESCVVSRKAGREALTGAHVDGVLSREISVNQDAERCLFGGKAISVGALSRAPTGPARSKTPIGMEPQRARTGRPCQRRHEADRTGRER